MEDLIVTGGLGFIGSNFIHHMIQSHPDFRVTNVDFMGFGSNPANVRELKRNTRYRFVEGDIADYTFTRKVLKNARIVVNFAAETHVDRSIANPAPFFESNTKGAFNLLRAAYERNVDKLVHISTDEIYGAIDSGSFDERSPANPSSPYSATKAAADLMAQAWNVTYKLPVIVLRCTNNFGPRQHPEKLIPKTIIRAMKGKAIPLYGGGRVVDPNGRSLQVSPSVTGKLFMPIFLGSPTYCPSSRALALSRISLSSFLSSKLIVSCRSSNLASPRTVRIQRGKNTSFSFPMVLYT